MKRFAVTVLMAPFLFCGAVAALVWLGLQVGFDTATEAIEAIYLEGDPDYEARKNHQAESGS